MTADKHSEAQRLLHDLDYMVEYWEQQACLATNAKQVASFLQKKERCRTMASQIRGLAEPSA